MTSRFFILSFALTAVLAGATIALRQAGPNAPIPEAPSVVSPAFDILMAQAFRVDEPFVHTWRAESPTVRAGYLLVLDVDPVYVRPRQGLEPVLYVGTQTAERLNVGFPSGRVVALVPAPLTDTGAPDLELDEALIWFGSPELPERVDQERIALEHDRARDAGVRPLRAARVQSAIDTRTTGGAAVMQFADRTELERHAARQMLVFAPDDSETARGILVPLVR